MAASTFLSIAKNQVRLFTEGNGTYQIQNKSFEDLQVVEITDIGQLHQDTEMNFLTLNMIGSCFVVGPFQYACITKETGSEIYMWYEEAKGGVVAISETE